ncbi:bap28 [Holotrichia oblita]|uniref:Bap28 n=1 Tax=Holotrichia oblita TaxID=644536 RepID=A0ACB9TDY7_HOLOL|nr:bap28 [Holotrichia oblita]
MATSLAEQLKRLTVPQTSPLKQDKKKASLLFDKRQAAEISREAFYQIGLDGFEELKLKYSLFAPFENTLFHATSKEFERSVQDATANERLDKQIRKFFLLLSPYLSFTCAHKALEWLINRYNIQEYNRNDFLMLILPYHETNIFVRALQLIKINEASDSFAWLKNIQKSGVHLSKSLLHEFAAKSPQFLKEIGEFTLQALKEHDQAHKASIVINFYCMTVTGAIEYAPNVQESLITEILSVLLRGQKSSVTDFCAGSYIITGKLLSKTELCEKVLNKFVNNISIIPVDHLKTEAILLLIILYQTQVHFSGMSELAVKNLASKPYITKILRQLSSEKYFVDSLIMLLLKRSIECCLIEKECNELHTFVLTLLNDIQLANVSVSELISITLETYGKNKKSISENIQMFNWVTNIISTIETQYPDAFDKEVSRIMRIEPGNHLTKVQKHLQKLIVNSRSKTEIDLFEKLYHPVCDIRKETIKYYVKIYNDLKDREQDYLKKFILEQLTADDPDMICSILNKSKKLLPQIFVHTILADVLIMLLKKAYSNDGWYKTIYPTLSILCTLPNEDDIKTFVAVLPFLLPVKDLDMKKALLVVNSDYFTHSKYFHNFDIEALKKTTDCTKFFDKIVYSLKTIQIDTSQIVTVLESSLVANEYAVSRCITAMILCEVLPDTVPSNISSLILNIFKTGFNELSIITTNSKTIIQNYLFLSRQNKIPLEGILYCISMLIQKTEIPTSKLELYELSPFTNDVNVFLMDLLDFLLKGCYTRLDNGAKLYANTLKQFLSRFFPNFQSTLDYLWNISITTKLNTPLQLRAVRTVMALTDALSTEVLFKESSVVVAHMLIGMSSKHKEIRVCTMNIVASILTNINIKFEPDFTTLLKNILDCREEIIVDSAQVSTIINHIYELQKIKPMVISLVELVNNEHFSLHLRVCLANVLITIDDFHVFTNLSKLAIEVLQKNTEKLQDLNEHTYVLLYNILTTLNANNISKLCKDSSCYKMLEICLRSDSIIIEHESISGTLSILCIQSIQKIFEYFAEEVAFDILHSIIEIATTTSNADVVIAVRKMFKHIDLDANLIVQQFVAMYNTLQPKCDASKRKRRVSSIPTADILETLEWKRGIVTLELLQDKKKIRNPELLIPFIFNILKKCVDFDEQSNVEYPKQLLLSTLLNCCTKVEDHNLSENIFNVEVLVQCIRASQNPQTHYHALLVLAYTANYVPKQVLHHMIAIFTFMGSSVLRHDDSYSFQIITKIVDTIIPIILQDHSLVNVVNVLRVFIDAVLDVPEHRRINLYNNLLQKLGAGDTLYLFVLLMLEAYVLHINNEKQKYKNIADKSIIAPKRLDITADICRKFAPEIVIENCVKLIAYLQQLPEEKENVSKVNLPFDITHQTPKQYRHFKYAIVTFISSLLSSPEFISNIASLSKENQQQLEIVYKNMIISIITFIQYIAKITDKTKDTSQAHYWKMILHHSYDVLDSINGLLTPHMFLLVIRGLTTHNLHHIRRRSLELLNTKLQQDIEFFDDCTESEIYAMIPALLGIIKQSESDENQITVQTAFLSLKLIIKFFAKQNTEKFIDVLNYLTDFIKTTKVQGNILASAILCLAELCNHLRAYAIPNLNKFMPTFMKILKINREQEYPDLLLLSTLTAILKILDSLPLFLSSYLDKLLYEISLLLSKWQNSTNSKMQPTVGKLKIMKEKIGVVIPARILFPAINKTYDQLIENKDYSSIGTLMDILSEKLSRLSSSEIQGDIPELTSFFLNTLRFRSDQLLLFSEINRVEKEIVSAATTFILKLSETAFRPLYYKIYDWAVNHETKSERLITFYALSSNIADNLKTLYVLFAGHIVNNAAIVLDLCNTVKNSTLYYESQEKSLMLLELVLKTLHSIFLYDNRNFIDKERFDILMQPIVDQLENVLGNETLFTSRVEKLVIPCIVQFTIAAGDDTYWKQIHYQILLKLRHSSPIIRILSLKCVLQVAIKLGADFLPLLPETIPFLAELLEDENQEVERVCQRTVQELEKILGESLQKYF